MIYQIDTSLLKKWKKHLKKDLKGLNIEFKPLSLTENQLAEVKVLEEKYRSEEWLYKNRYKQGGLRVLILLNLLVLFSLSFIFSDCSSIFSLIFCKEEEIIDKVNNKSNHYKCENCFHERHYKIFRFSSKPIAAIIKTK